MDNAAQTTSGGGTRQFAYFVLRIQRDPTDPDAALAGVLERLGSGRARRFDGAEELLALLTDGVEETSSLWSQPGRK